MTLICILGPILNVYGAVFSDVAVVEPLTVGFHLIFLQNDHKMMTALSSTFRALKISLQNLDEYYKNPPQILRREHPLFPNVKIGDAFYKVCINSQYGDSLLWEAVLQEVDGASEFVAYVKAAQNKNYSLEVHKFLEHDKYAPTIFASIDIPGEWRLVYMQYLNNHLVLNKIAPTLNDKERNSLKEKICGVVNHLHESGYVHGDLNEEHILVCQDENDNNGFDVKLINFKWSGKDGSACYSSHIMNNNMCWPDWVEYGKPVTMDHDRAMLTQTFQKTNLL
jgi:serine/threonine protein kinase